VLLLGLAFAALSAFVTDVGFLMRQRGATSAPDVDIRTPLRTVAGLFREKWWTLGYGVAFVAWALHVVSLKLAPLSLVQATLASGFVMLAVIAERCFGFKVGRREWIGISLCAAGLALLGVTAHSTTGAHAGYGVAAAVAFEGGLIVCGALALIGHRHPRANGHAGPLLAAGAGLLFTVSHIATKALSSRVSVSDPGSLLTPWVAVLLLAFVGAFFASARSLQVGDAVPVIAITSAVSNASAILGGVVVFHDPLGSDALQISLRVFAFALVILAAAVMPAPVRAAGHRRDERRSGHAAPAASPG
jgi:drug/metabolite transporter (DMT)-like permease